MPLDKPDKVDKSSLYEKYKKFLSKTYSHRNGLSNPFNLFDELNKTDKIWVKIAQKYLYKKSRRPD